MKRVGIGLLIGCLLSGAALAADDAAANKPGDAKPVNAVITIGMIGNLVETVGGECVDATTIMGPGTDPHLYEPRPSDVQAFRDAEIIFYSGYTLEGQLGDVLEKFGRQKPTVAVSPASIEPSELIQTQDIYGIDPHLWMDVALWSQTVPTMAEKLSKVRPACADTFQANAETLQPTLAALDGWIEKSVASIPESQRILVTAHDAFSYYGRAYGIEVAGIQGISTESQAGIADIREMAKTVAERNVPAVFIESTINPRTIQAVVDAAEERGQPVEIGGELYSDAMGGPDEVGGTYIGMLYANTRTIVNALGGEPAPLPDALAEWAAAHDVDAGA